VANATFHTPVLVEEILRLLALRAGALIVDGTVGGGGHAEAILEATAPDGQLVGLDVDDEALTEAAYRLRRFGDRVRLLRSSFRELRGVAERLGLAPLDGVLLDLGVSGRQIDAPERGFRFAGESAEATPLDMRMDRRAPRTAADLLATAPAASLATWFREYGELPGAHRLAQAIVAARATRPLCTTGDLLRVIRAARIGRGRRHDPATLVFQALRIAVNDELAALAEGLDAAIDGLAPGGRVAVVSYHSLEDRTVKQRFREAARGCLCPPKTPVCVCGRTPRLRLVTKRAVRPTPAELQRNPRARSARLRAAERLKEAA
jgi:16S rRNA (cytosine1402-N4)-methyltransferase